MPFAFICFMTHLIFEENNKRYRAKLSEAIDLSIPLVAEQNQLAAWYVPPISIEPVRADGFVGAVAEGGSVNFRNITFNPHGHGTHTECLGHITPEVFSVNKLIKDFHLVAELITVLPKEQESPYAQGEKDLIIEKEQLLPLLENFQSKALIIRTLPNPIAKQNKNYSATNPPYISEDAMRLIVECGIKHLLIDLPSVDREVDGGHLKAHHIFWGVGATERRDCSITELIYVPNGVPDGKYYLNLQFPPFENDASPSRPIIYPLSSVD